MNYQKITYAQNSERSINPGNGHLYVTNCVLTSACVSEYLGSEIQGYESFGLDPAKRYGVLRPLEEIKKALNTYNGLSLLDKHIVVDAETPHQKEWIGTIGTEAIIKGNDLLNTVVVWLQDAINDITLADEGSAKGKKDLSVGYGYDIVEESGNFEGKPYQFKMTNIRGNHVALVDDGRVPNAQIADSNINLKGFKMKKMGLLTTLFGWAMDAKMRDSTELEKEIKEMKSKAADEFEGGMEEKENMVDSMEKKLEEMKAKEAAKDSKTKCDTKEEKMEDSEEEDPKEPRSKDKKAKDSEEKEHMEDQAIAMDEQKIAQKASQLAMDMMQENVKITALCESVIGRLPDAMLYDSASIKINKTLKIAQKDIDYSNKSTDVKIAVLETLAMNKQNKRQESIMQFSNDSAIPANHTSTNSLFNLIKGSK
jgi:hypothetical protein